ncbi:MAG: hypothetical protein P4M05_19615 [Bradyrhizobium sp.]|nr:hypothetical protein [Bradyrhizobium sp.]
MYINPILFPQISNRESWIQTVQIFDDNTGDLISLTDPTGIYAAYSVVLEIRPPRENGYSGYSGYSSQAWYGNSGEHAAIYEILQQGNAAVGSNSVISIVDTGTINIQVPRSNVERLRHQKTYDVYLTLNDDANDDGRQILIGRLPVFFGGRDT